MHSKHISFGQLAVAHRVWSAAPATGGHPRPAPPRRSTSPHSAGPTSARPVATRRRRGRSAAQPAEGGPLLATNGHRQAHIHTHVRTRTHQNITKYNANAKATQHDTIRHHTTRYNTTQFDTARHRTTRYNTAQQRTFTTLYMLIF